MLDYSNVLRKGICHLRAALRSFHGFLARRGVRLKRGRLRLVADQTTSYLDAALTEPSQLPRRRKTSQQNNPERKPVRVIAVSHNLDIEGAPLAQMELVLALAQSGAIDPTVVSPHDGHLRQEYESADISVRIVPAVNFASVQTFTQSLASVQNTLEACQADVIYANTLPNFWAVVAAKRMGLPSIWNIREVTPAAAHFDRLPKSVRSDAYRCFGHPYRVIFVSGASFNLSSRFDRHDNFDLIYDALDTERIEGRSAIIDRSAARAELGLADSELGVVAMGTIFKSKGQLDLIDALRRMPEHAASRVRVYIVGDKGSNYSNSFGQCGGVAAKASGLAHPDPAKGSSFPFILSCSRHCCVLLAA